MKKLLFAIFAHPDDESFGPSGTLLMEAKGGTEVHLISLTAGQAGMNPDNIDDLAAVRLGEWRQAGELIGATDMHHLGFKDGQLDNQALQTASQRISKIITNYARQQDDDFEIELMSNDLNGISGHIDHIVAARAACLAFYRLRAQGLPMRRIRLACLPRQQSPKMNVNWLYMEPGRSEGEIDEVIDASQHYDTILRTVRAHRTQRKDGEKHIERLGEQLAIDYFMILD